MESHRETGKREKGTAALPLLPVVTALLGNMLRLRGELAAIAGNRGAQPLVSAVLSVAAAI
nr:hypothetical protein Iba_chr13aCG6910 [Ipomoea batatas]